MVLLAGLLVSGVAVALANGREESPDEKTVSVPWARYPPGVRKVIDDTSLCAELQETLGIFVAGGQDAEVVKYIVAKMQRLECPGYEGE